MASPTYKIQIWDFDPTTFGPRNLVVELENAKNVGWANALNEVSQAFFTLDNDDPKVLKLRGYEGKSHVKIYRNGSLVWSGWWLEYDAGVNDVVCYAYGYLAGLHWTETDWATKWTSQQINTIVSDLWTRAKTTLTNSTLSWVTTGTIEAPVTTSGGATPIVLPLYQVFYKKILYAFKELAALAISDTTNTVIFEITPAGTFNFWKNRGVDRSLTLRFGDDKVSSYHDTRLLANRRNEINAVGASPLDAALKTTITQSGGDLAAWGRRQDSVFFSYVRDATELDRATRLRAAKAARDDVSINISLYPNAITPPDAAGSLVSLGDRLTVKVDNGLTNISALQLLTAYQVISMRGVEYVKLRMQDRSGT